MIKAKDIYKAFGNNEVLRGVSVDIEAGEFAVILGASGSGKSTLMNLLSGLGRADGGEIQVDGQNLTQMNESELTKFRRERVGFVFQQYYLLPHLTVAANVKMGASLVKNIDYTQILTSLGLGDKLKAKPATLSGGEQQRVCIARALAKKPKILFLDEPTGALDEKTGREVLNYILQEKAKTGFTMVMVTHNINIAQAADKIIKINSGKIIAVVKNTSIKTAFEIGW